ncbi:carbohydrate kinase [Pelomyxa schiedti]|nr:carbohydrate kinase [Pelomyxa schiedti]KAH3757501.1 carbohydrate kinase [Pelomyxa schiedti]
MAATTPSVLFVGDTARDKIGTRGDGSPIFVAGGGVYYGGIACSSCGMSNVSVVTKCAAKDVPLYTADFARAGVKVTYLPSVESTQCEHAFPTGNPDNRVTVAVTLADPFTEGDITSLPNCPCIMLNPLYKGACPELLLPLLKKKTPFLAADAQGFVRCVEDTVMVRHPWQHMEQWLPYIDLFKIDSLEGELLTGSADLPSACRLLHQAGANDILATHQDGVFLSRKDGSLFEARWGSWKLEGRTGRGDTVTAAFITALLQKGLVGQEALNFAAEICTRKMQKAGPFWG